MLTIHFERVITYLFVCQGTFLLEVTEVVFYLWHNRFYCKRFRIETVKVFEYFSVETSYYMASVSSRYNARSEQLSDGALFSRNAHGPIMDYAN